MYNGCFYMRTCCGIIVQVYGTWLQHSLSYCHAESVRNHADLMHMREIKKEETWENNIDNNYIIKLVNNLFKMFHKQILTSFRILFSSSIHTAMIFDRQVIREITFKSMPYKGSTTSAIYYYSPYLDVFKEGQQWREVRKSLQKFLLSYCCNKIYNSLSHLNPMRGKTIRVTQIIM